MQTRLGVASLAAIAMACFVAGQVDMARAHLARMESLAELSGEAR